LQIAAEIVLGRNFFFTKIITMKSTNKTICDESNFTGNRRETCLDLVGYDGKTLREKFIIAEPRACSAGSAEKMKRDGFVGLYTLPKNDFKLRITEASAAFCEQGICEF
jgi:hypothetical protein